MAREKQKPLKNKKLGFVPSKTPKIAQVVPKKKLNYEKLFNRHYPKEAEPIKEEWIKFAEKNKLNAKDFRRLRPIVDLILKNSYPDPGKYSLEALNSLLKNPNLKPSYLPLLHKIAENTKDRNKDEKLLALTALDSLLENTNFKPSYLPLLNKIVDNTKDYSIRIPLYALNILLENTNFKPSYLPLLQKIVENTKDEKIEEALIALDSLLKNTNFKPEHLKQFELIFDNIIRNTKDSSTFYSLKALNTLLENTNFKPFHFPLLQKITENTKGESTEHSLEALNSLLKNLNLKPSYLPLLQKIVENTKGEEIEYSLRALDPLLRNPNFYPEHLSVPLVNIMNLTKKMIKNTEKKVIFYSLRALDYLLENTNFKPFHLPLLQKIVDNTKNKETRYALRALVFLLENTNLKPEYLNSFLNNEPLFFTILFSEYPASIELGKPLDTLHDNSTKRKQYLNSLTNYQVLALLLSDPEYFYTSSNKMLVERFQGDLEKEKYKFKGKTIKDPYLLLRQLTLFNNELGKEKLRNLTARLITYDLFTGDKGVFSEENAGKLINVFTEPIEKLKLEDNYLFLLGNMIERLEKGKNIELIKRKLEENLSKTKGKNRKAFEFLLTAIDKNTNLVSEEKKKEISKLIQERSTFRPQKFVSKGKFTVVQVFGKEGGLWAGTYLGLKRNFKLKETVSEIKGEGTLNEKTGRIILENDKVRFILIRGEAEKAEEVLKQTIKENPNGVYIFRGHSYNLTKYFSTKIFNENGAKNTLFFPGSCGSSSAIPKYLRNNKSIVNFLANRRIGEAGVSRYLAQEMVKYYSRTTKPIKFSDFLMKRARELEKRKGDVNSMSYGSFGEILISYLYGR